MTTYKKNITYSGYTISKENINSIIYWCKKYQILPTGMICQTYLESQWGNEGAGANEGLNNWGGLTYFSDTQFPPEINYTIGDPRPPDEGGYYVRFATMSDYFHAHAYLLGSEELGGAGIYKVSGKNTVQGYARGLFRYGGAIYDYAVSWEHYESLMIEIENGIIESNPDFNTINNMVGIDNGTPHPTSKKKFKWWLFT